MTTPESRTPGIGISLVPIITLIGLLILNVVLFKDDATGAQSVGTSYCRYDDDGNWMSLFEDSLQKD